jgi:hypothetical protein
MRPGAFSRRGFLGAAEKLTDVIAADALTLKSMNLDCARIAAALESLITAAEQSPERSAFAGSLQCRVQIHQGFQICPWASDPRRGQCTAGGGVRHASVEWSIINVATGETLRGPGLIVHLIRDHQFFEGTHSPDRVDPERLAALLGLA